MKSVIAAGIVSLALTGNPVEVGDGYFSSMDYPRAIGAYDAILQEDPDRAEVLWKTSRALVALAEISPTHQRDSLWREAEKYARRCIAADSLVAEGHTWLAASLGNIALFAGKSEKVRLAREIAHELRIALSLRQDDDATYSILGSFNHALGNVGWIERQIATLFYGPIPKGGYEEAEAAFDRAISIAPDVLRHRYELGLLLLDWGREEEAYAAFRSALQLPIKIAGDSVAQRRMKELLPETTTGLE